MPRRPLDRIIELIDRVLVEAKVAARPKRARVPSPRRRTDCVSADGRPQQFPVSSWSASGGRHPGPAEPTMIPKAVATCTTLITNSVRYGSTLDSSRRPSLRSTTASVRWCAYQIADGARPSHSPASEG